MFVYPRDGTVKSQKENMGKTAGKNDVLIYSPKNKKFRSKNEVKKYFDENCECILKVHQFDFSVSGKKLV